jgi:protein-tyrosine-phosphatase
MSPTVEAPHVTEPYLTPRTSGASIRAIPGALRRFTRDAIWSVLAFGLRNPPLAGPPRSLMFVCKGNICRSPFAELAAKRWLDRAGIFQVDCSSSGLEAVPGTPSPREAVEAASELGVLLTQHRSTTYALELAGAGGAIVVFEVGHFVQLRRHRTLRERVLLLPLFLPREMTGWGYRRVAIEDPYGKPIAHFRRVYETIELALDAFLSQLYTPRGTSRDVTSRPDTGRTWDGGSAAAS